MFYGKLNDETIPRMRNALKDMNEICGPMYAADNLIGLQRAAGFREDEKFSETVGNGVP